MNIPEPTFRHVERLSDDTGILEHAWHTVPRLECGYTLDDVTRALIAICLAPAPEPELIGLAYRYLAFIRHARRDDGRFHNRMSYQRQWEDDIGSQDCHGRALWALGVAAQRAPTSRLREAASALFVDCPALDTRYLRSNAYAVLGATEMLASDASSARARTLLAIATDRLDKPTRNAGDGQWPWPESFLSYDNARIPEALMKAGRWRNRRDLSDRGLALLEWLVEVQLRDSHFSFVPVGGWSAGEPLPGFDQQPIEAAAMADACATAFDLTGDTVWANRVVLCAHWFLGHNDSGAVLLDPISGGCADGLESGGVNLNQGAESTLACITTLQQALHGRALAGIGNNPERVEHVQLVNHGRTDREVGRAIG